MRRSLPQLASASQGSTPVKVPRELRLEIHSRTAISYLREHIKRLVNPKRRVTPKPKGKKITNMDSQIFNTMTSFPRSFTLESAGVLSSNHRIVDDIDASPLHYITHHSTFFSGEPHVILHIGPDKSSPTLASASFHSFSSSIDIIISLGQPTTPIKISHNRTGFFSQSWSFFFTLPSDEREHFECKKSSCAAVAALGGKSKGLKLVRTMNGEVVAVFADTTWGMRRRNGRFGFTFRESLGREFELMAVISMLAVVEKIERQKKSSSAGHA